MDNLPLRLVFAAGQSALKISLTGKTVIAGNRPEPSAT